MPSRRIRLVRHTGRNMRSLAFLIGFIVCCSFSQSHAAAEVGDAAFNQIANEFISGYLAWRPGMAVGLGLHEYDGKAPDLSRESIRRELDRLKVFEGRLKGLNWTLSAQADYDRRILLSAIEGDIFGLEDVRGYYRNPSSYVLGEDINVYVTRNFAPPQQRLASIVEIEKAVPQIVATARENLDEVLPKPFVEAAIRNVKGAASFLETDLPAAFKGVGDEGLIARFHDANTKAAASLHEYASYLETEKLSGANASFALGAEKYKKMLQTEEMLTLSPERILEIGLRQLKHEQETFAAAARVIDPNRSPVEVYRAIQKDHPTADGLIPDARRDLDAIRQFVIDRQLVSVPSAVRAKVMETPPFARAGNFASMSTPGPFETKATEAIYYITPVEREWPAARQEQWLTAFNYYTLDVVSIHEAYPGHYVQFQHLNASPATKVEKIFGSYAYIEGWAHYCEQMVLDEGFGGSDRVRAARFRLAQSAEALLRLCRLCCSVKMHCQGMSLDEAARFFQNNCYYEAGPAREEALRGTFDPGYLYYSIGKMELLKLREDYRRQEGATFSLLKFHDQVLGHGMPPIRLLRELMLKDRSLYDQEL